MAYSKLMVRFAPWVLCLFFLAFAKAQETPTTPQDSTSTGSKVGKLSLPDPPSITTMYNYDPNLDRYILDRRFNGYSIGYPFMLTRDEYSKLVLKESMNAYFLEKFKAVQGKTEEDKENQRDLIPNFYVNSDLFTSIFGGNEIDLDPQGSVEVDLGILFNRTDNPALSPRNRQNLTFDFNQRINLSMVGTVGTRLSVNANYDTQSTFNFQNLIKLEYTPTEDDILQSIELGNVAMPLNSQLIRGSQSLFGVKAELQFGRTRITGIFSEQRSEANTVQAAGGASFNEFDFFSLDYDENRHFFLSHYFRDTYDDALANYPFINNNIQITRVEVWVTNRSNRTENVRNIVGLQDLGEAGPDPDNIGLDNLPSGFFNVPPGSFPDNGNNDLNPRGLTGSAQTVLNQQIRDIGTVGQGFNLPDSQIDEGVDYVSQESARQLDPREYILNTQLGYISLRQKLNNDEVLAVAYQYTVGGRVYQVGEFANDGVNATEVQEDRQNPDPNTSPVVNNQNLVVKMLKSNLTNVGEPNWDLMMKNIYNLGGSQLSPEDFRLNIFYQYPPELNYITPAPGRGGNPSIPLPENVEETTLLRVFNLDRLNQQGDPQPTGDGFFDYVPGLTIDQENGRIIFTTVEPFGEHIFDELAVGGENYGDPTTYNNNQAQYVFREMYETTKAQALEATDKNKYLIKGEYKSSGQEGIPIGGFNVARGSVVVTAGGRTLQEGIDYTVDYNAGRVIILDQALLNSSTPIQVSTENNSVFNQQTKRFTGINVEHTFSEDFVLGGTLLNLNERPITQKATYGFEPINNTIVGTNFNYSTEVPFFTRLVNKLPNIDTDVESRLSVRGEFAYLFPGTPSGDNFAGEAATYVDDFEGSQTTIDIMNPNAWTLASTPFGFGNDDSSDPPLEDNFRRARIAWYAVDPIFYGNQRPDGITDQDVSEYRTRRVLINEIFPQVDIQQGQQQVINTLDLAYYPDERGPYNYNPAAAGSNTLPNPANNWGGIMRQFSSTDFEQTNVEYIQFWVLDPYVNDPTMSNGKIVLNIGSISEDILQDGRKQFENGLPENDNVQQLVTTTPYGKVPSNQSLVYAFDTAGQERNNQDVGLDGLDDVEEVSQFPDFASLPDPSADNYEYFLATDGDIPERYKRFNNTQGNSPTDVGQNDRGSTTLPDVEDINRDNTMNTIDNYYSYEVNFRNGLQEGDQYVYNILPTRQVELPNGQQIEARWIQFRVPLRQIEDQTVNPGYSRVGNINDFRAIRFMRMYLTDFDTDAYLRFGTLELVRGDYRQYTQNLASESAMPNDNTTFEVQGVNIENNATRDPVNYVLPPGVEREVLNTQNQNIRQNEQSLALRVCELAPEDARAVFKNVRIDMRQYEDLEMFVHADRGGFPTSLLEDDELEAFVRIGLDFTQNYYEVRLPLKVTPAGANTPGEVWPDANNFKIDLSILGEIKSEVLGETSLSVNELQVFEPDADFYNDEGLDPRGHTYAIIGNPNFGDVRAMMIGVRNASDNDQCGEVWFNEMRLSGLKNQGGYATILNLDTNFADFATINANGSRSTIGFGAIEQGPNERSRENVTAYDFTTNMSLGKLLPQKWGVKLPFSYSFAEETITPQFDPQFEDIELETRLDNAANDADRETIREQSEEYTKRQSVNLIGVRKERTGESKPMPYDIENFTFSGSYNQTDQRSFEIEEFQDQSTTVGAQYAYAFPKAEVAPFKKVKLFANDYWKWLRELNFNLLPNNFTAGVNIQRQYNIQRFRDLTLDAPPVDLDGDGTPDAQNITLAPLTNRNFTLDNSYSINWDLTKSLKINLAANNNRIIRSYIDENDVVDESYTLWTDFLDDGIADNHSQQFTAIYELPFDKFPFLAFAKANYSYTADFNWTRNQQQFLDLGDIPNLGNSISNANNHVLNGTLDFEKLYKYIGFEKLKFGAEANAARNRSRSRSRNRNSNRPPSGQQSNEDEDKPKIPKKNVGNQLYNTFVGLATAIKRVQVNYAQNNGTFLPGYTPDVGFIGTLKPSPGFVYGQQEDIRQEAARRGWLTLFQDFNQQYQETESRNFDYNIKVGLLKDLSLDLTGNRIYQETYAENYRVDPTDLTYQSLTPNTFGNFSISTVMIGTAFNKSTIDESETFDNFKTNRLEVAEKLAREFYGTDNFERDDQDFPLGFSRNSQRVLLPSFLAAYEGRDVSKQDSNPFKDIPLPNWNLKYTGLMNLNWFKKRFNRFSINHGYRSSFTVNRFQTNLDFVAGNPNLSYQNQLDNTINASGDFKSANLYFNINLAEQFSPLIKLDFETKRGFTIAAEVIRDRAVSLSFDNNLLTEINGNQYNLGVGYRIKDLRLRTNFGGRSRIIKSDLNLGLEGSVRENITIVRYLDLDNSQATGGQTIYGLKFNADYAFSRAFTAIFYYDHTFSEFAISTAFPQTTIRSGITLRYTFGN